MSYPICRVRKISDIDLLQKAEEHNARLYEERGKPLPKNIHPERDGVRGFNSYEQVYEGPDLATSITNKFKSLGVVPRVNSVLAHEYILGVSNDWYEKANYSEHGMLTNLLRFAVEKYGLKNIASVAYHFDETTPHIHVICIPLVEKEHKWKNRNGQGVQIKLGLSGSDFIDGKDTLSKLQDDFHAYASKWNRPNAIIYRGLKAEETKKQYTERTNHLLGEMRTLVHEVEKIKEEISNNINIDGNLEKLHSRLQNQEELRKQIDVSQEEIAKLEKDIKRRRQQNENGGWKKGMDFNDM